jgi:hypothetical protein
MNLRRTEVWKTRQVAVFGHWMMVTSAAVLLQLVLLRDSSYYCVNNWDKF